MYIPLDTYQDMFKIFYIIYKTYCQEFFILFTKVIINSLNNACNKSIRKNT